MECEAFADLILSIKLAPKGQTHAVFMFSWEMQNKYVVYLSDRKS